VIREKPRNHGWAGTVQGNGNRRAAAAKRPARARSNHYQVEHDLLLEAIRQDKPYNEAERCASAALVGIMGRMAALSGKTITWDEALHSNIKLAPGLDKLTIQSPPSVKPDAAGHYPIAMPGFTTTM